MQAFISDLKNPAEAKKAKALSPKPKKKRSPKDSAIVKASPKAKKSLGFDMAEAAEETLEGAGNSVYADMRKGLKSYKAPQRRRLTSDGSTKEDPVDTYKNMRNILKKTRTPLTDSAPATAKPKSSANVEPTSKMTNRIQNVPPREDRVKKKKTKPRRARISAFRMFTKPKKSTPRAPVNVADEAEGDNTRTRPSGSFFGRLRGSFSGLGSSKAERTNEEKALGARLRNDARARNKPKKANKLQTFLAANSSADSPTNAAKKIATENSRKNVKSIRIVKEKGETDYRGRPKKVVCGVCDRRIKKGDSKTIETNEKTGAIGTFHTNCVRCELCRVVVGGERTIALRQKKEALLCEKCKDNVEKLKASKNKFL